MKTVDAIRKSMNAARTDAKGNTSRGKYIFVTRFMLLTREVEAKEMEVARNVQGKRAT